MIELKMKRGDFDKFYVDGTPDEVLTDMIIVMQEIFDTLPCELQAAIAKKMKTEKFWKTILKGGKSYDVFFGEESKAESAAYPQSTKFFDVEADKNELKLLSNILDKLSNPNITNLLQTLMTEDKNNG